MACVENSKGTLSITSCCFSNKILKKGIAMVIEKSEKNTAKKLDIIAITTYRQYLETNRKTLKIFLNI